ncbi:MAG: hypothetical protein LBL33_09220 [Tannerella sp.]|jgi:hypothetical protein|nr:hypothetical protein [Tannerella sp.]
MKLKRCCFLLSLICAVHADCGAQAEYPSDAPRIINIVNFIRQTDYRLENSDSLLFETVREQIALVNRYGFPATFLFQYDALINPSYQELMKTRLAPNCEIGAWWEITQPHVEAAGLPWRGEHSWVSTANVAFTTGYTPEERERLADVYMAKFKEIYGEYPKSAGSWFIDSHTLAYMHEKYGIVASCNCKDQIGTDGYTLWGGYWNQAYYPSRANAYMPAQTDEYRIPVPVFRMLGSDPIYQYDTGLGRRSQGVISLEPVYRESGMSEAWVRYFLQSVVDRPSLAFGYAQAGQENSFTWQAMQKGLEMQFPLLDSLKRANRIRLETLGTSGAWFGERFRHTPPTAVVTLADIRGEGRKTVWFNSRYYRANLLWEGRSFRFRDIHLFDERFESEYLNKAGVGEQFLYFTLPLVDGFLWSTPDERAGLRIVKIGSDGTATETSFDDPVVEETAPDVLSITCRDGDANIFRITFREDCLEVSCEPRSTDFAWALELKTARDAALPFRSMEERRISAEFRDFRYSVTCLEGTVRQGRDAADYVLRLAPSENRLSLGMKMEH